MISVKDSLPQENTLVKYKADVWRFGSIVNTYYGNAVYLGMNKCIGRPMFDIEDGDEQYTEVTEWDYKDETK